jgi:hypothetical protein
LPGPSWPILPRPARPSANVTHEGTGWQSRCLDQGRWSRLRPG